MRNILTSLYVLEDVSFLLLLCKVIVLESKTNHAIHESPYLVFNSSADPRALILPLIIIAILSLTYSASSIICVH